jgi:hypothetical protein
MYCTYLTIYSGNKLPRRYIGSSKVERISQGYNGSIKSKKYKLTYLEEQAENKHLFKTRILGLYETQQEAIAAEKDLHIKHNVVKSDLYMNMAIACVEGYFGRDISGEAHHFYGKKLSGDFKKSVSDGMKKAYAEGRAKSHFANPNWSAVGENNPFYGKVHSDETKQKMSKPKKYVPRWKCGCCDKVLDGGNLVNHMKHKHNWNKEDVKKYKEETVPVN